MAVERWAMVDSNNITIGVCMWDGDIKTWKPPANVKMVKVSTDPGVETRGQTPDQNPPSIEDRLTAIEARLPKT